MFSIPAKWCFEDGARESTSSSLVELHPYCTSLQYGWQKQRLRGDESSSDKYCSIKCPTTLFRTLRFSFFSINYRVLRGDPNHRPTQVQRGEGTVLMWLSRAAPYGLCPPWSKWAPAAAGIPARPSKAFQAGLKTQPSPSRTHVRGDSDFYTLTNVRFLNWPSYNRDFSCQKKTCILFRVKRGQETVLVDLLVRCIFSSSWNCFECNSSIGWMFQAGLAATLELPAAK